MVISLAKAEASKLRAKGAGQARKNIDIKTGHGTKIAGSLLRRLYRKQPKKKMTGGEGVL
jgi:hypothetical protein